MGELTILSKKYKVTEYETVAEQGSYGTLRFSQQSIHVAKDIHIANKRLTVIHEVVHAISVELSLDLKEEIVVALACGLNSWMTDSGFDMGKLFGKWVHEPIKEASGD